MKFSPTLAAALAFTLMTPAFAESSTAVNAQIQKVIDQSFQADELIEGVRFWVNPKSASIDPLRLQIEATATAKSSPWAQNEKTIVKFSAKTASAAPQANGLIPVSAQLRMGLQTQVVRLVNFLATKYLQRLGTPPSDPAELADYQKLESLAKTFVQAKTLGEISPALVELKNLLAQQKDSDSKFLSKIQIVTETVDGATRSLTIRYTEKVDVFGVSIKNIALKLNDSTILGGCMVVDKIKQQQLAEIQELVTETAKKVENGDVETQEALKGAIAGWAETAKEMLSSEKFN
jgi:hypothetical protein